MKRSGKESLRLDVAEACLWHGRRRIALKPKDFAVLRCLVEQPKQLVTKAALLDTVWPGTVVTEAVLKACVNRVRQALGDHARTPRFIETVHRRGYRLIGPLSITTRRVSRSTLRVPHSKAKSRGSAIRHPPSAMNMVGREPELAQLRKRLDTALAGKRQTVFVTGDAGLGKTTVVDAFLETIENHQTLWIGRGQCIDHYGSGEAFLPVFESLGSLCRQPDGQVLISYLAQRAPTWLTQLPGLLSVKDWSALQRRTLGTTRERMLRELIEVIDVVTAEKPLVLLLEDLQWSDASTVDLIAALAWRREPARLLVLGTYRPADTLQRGHPLHTAAHELRLHKLCTEVPLPVLNEAAVETYVTRRFREETLPAELVHVLYQRTGGHPFFMIAVVDHWLRQGLLAQVKGQWQLPKRLETLRREVPADLRQLINAQLDRLTPEEQRTVEAASIVGAEFSAVAVAGALGTKVAQVERLCTGLARRHFFLRPCGEQSWPDGTTTATYGFIHALYQEVIYDAVPTAQRLVLHRRIGKREETGYGPRAGEIAARLAMHFARGQDFSRAVRYHQQAAQNAIQRGGYHEAATHANAGLILLEEISATPTRATHGLALHHLRGMSLAAIKGVATAEVEQAYAQAYLLTRQVANAPQVFPILLGLWMFYALRGPLQTAHTLVEQLFRLAHQTEDEELLLQAHMSRGVSLLYSGEPVAAHTHFVQCRALYDPQRHHTHISRYGWDPGVVFHAHNAWALWLLGYPTQAVQESDKALTLALQSTHPYNIAFAQTFAAMLRQLRREVDYTHAQAAAVVALTTAEGFAHWRAMGLVLQGWALAMQGEGEKGTSQMQQGLNAWQAAGAEVGRLHWLVLLAEACETMGRVEEGRRTLDKARNVGAKTGERLYEAEFYRLKGDLLLAKEDENKKAKGLHP